MLSIPRIHKQRSGQSCYPYWWSKRGQKKPFNPGCPRFRLGTVQIWTSMRKIMGFCNVLRGLWRQSKFVPCQFLTKHAKLYARNGKCVHTNYYSPFLHLCRHHQVIMIMASCHPEPRQSLKTFNAVPRLRPARRQTWHSRGNLLSVSDLGNTKGISSAGKTRIGIISYPTSTLAHWSRKLVRRAATHVVEWASKRGSWLEDSVLDKLPWTAEKVTSNPHHWAPTAPSFLSKSGRG